MNLRFVGLVAVGLVVGFALGGVGPRRRVVELSQEQKRLQKQLADRERPNPLRMFFPRMDGPGRQPAGALPQQAVVAGPVSDAGVAQAAVPGDVPRSDSSEHSGRPAQPGQSEGAVVIGRTERRMPGLWRRPARDEQQAGPRDGRDAPQRDSEGDDSGRPRRTPKERLEDFERMATAQRTRIASSRAALVQQAGLDPAQTAQLDATLQRMNGRLSGYGEEMIEQMATDTPPPPAQVLGLGHDVSGIMFEGQQELDGIVGEASEGVDPQAMEIWNYIDFDQWRPFVEERMAPDSAPPGGGAQGAGSGEATPPTSTGQP